MVGRKNVMAEFWPNFAKSGRKFFLYKCLRAEMTKMTQDTKKFAQHLDFCRKLLDKKTTF